MPLNKETKLKLGKSKTNTYNERENALGPIKFPEDNVFNLCKAVVMLTIGYSLGFTAYQPF